MTGRETWAEVDAFVEHTAVRAAPRYGAAARSAADAGLPPIAVPPAQGKFLGLLAKAIGARRILEIGTLGGYSTMWLAEALPDDGVVVTLELEARHAEVARANLENAGLAERVEIVVGNALESLGRIEGPFDLAFIDADKPNVPPYFDRCVELLRPGGLVVVDNVVRNGALADPESEDPNVVGVRSFHQLLAGRDDVEATTIQTVGAKGYDGFTLALKR